MMYPGYAPIRGVDYKVFHYGLTYKVGDWVFDKAEWRDTDLVNKCWAKFPDPPDPLTLDRSNEDAYNRDLLSIECARTLNDALYLHHKQRNCPDPSTLATLDMMAAKKEEITRKFRKVIESDATISNSRENDESEEPLKRPTSDKVFSSFRFWVVALWVVSLLGFLVLMVTVCHGGKKRKTKGKHHKNKKRSSYTGLFDLNGRNAEISDKL